MGKLCEFMLPCIALCYKSNPISFLQTLLQRKSKEVPDLANIADLLSQPFIIYRFPWHVL